MSPEEFDTYKNVSLSLSLHKNDATKTQAGVSISVFSNKRYCPYLTNGHNHKRQSKVLKEK